MRSSPTKSSTPLRRTSSSAATTRGTNAVSRSRAHDWCSSIVRLPKDALLDAARGRFPAQGDYASEVNPAAEALVTSLAQRCEAGVLLVIDYGFPSAEYYHPQRNTGTLMAHYRHRALADVLFLPGLADLTAHVDFSAIAERGVGAGMTLGGFTSQARFLINCGLLGLLAQTGDPSSAAYLARSGRGAKAPLARGDGRVVQGAGADAWYR